MNTYNKLQMLAHLQLAEDKVDKLMGMDIAELDSDTLIKLAESLERMKEKTSRMIDVKMDHMKAVAFVIKGAALYKKISGS